MHESSHHRPQAAGAGAHRRPISPRHLVGALVPTAVAAAIAAGTATATPASGDQQPRDRAVATYHHRGMRHKKPVPPIAVTVFSPGDGDRSGVAGAGFIVDIALDATKVRYNSLLSAQAGYKPFFNAPGSSTFHPGPDPGAPGLVVLLSNTPTIAGTPFQGPGTNLAGLFQDNGVARVMGNKAEVWDTWQAGKALWGTGPETLTVYVVKGTAPANVAGVLLQKISNVVRVHFRIA